MDKNTVMGFILIAGVLIGFSILNRPSDEELQKQAERKRRDSIEYVNTQLEALKVQENTGAQTGVEKDIVDNFFDVPAVVETTTEPLAEKSVQVLEEKVVTLENSKLKIDFSTKGGQMLSAQLKNYSRYDNDSLYIFNKDAGMDLLLTNRSNNVLHTADLVFKHVETQDNNSLIMRYSYSEKQYVDFIYKLAEDDYMLKFDVNLVGMTEILSRDRAEFVELLLTHKMRRQETNKKNEQRYSSLYYKYVGDDVKELDAAKDDSQEIKEPTKWIAFKNQFFASVIIADDKISVAQVDSKVLESEDHIKACQARIFAPVQVAAGGDILHAGFSYFMGPMSYSLLKDYDANVKSAGEELDMDKMVPLGWALFRWINQYFVIPLFNLLKTSGLSMGIVILLLTLVVKLIISPLTYKSFMSSAKMRVLKPQVDAIGEKYPKQEQAMEKQQAVMALYNKAGANPMSGCIPMLLQMPILIALFQFFPNAIELRHQSFLWASDLSTYDSIWSFPEGLPLIGGTHLSLFCILMTITNIVYTKFNMDATNTGQQQMPGMKWMMYLMPLIFFFVLNDYPSGLTYYYFVSLLITIILTLVFRYTVDEKKVLARLEANKAKPKKKSGFMARLEEAQRIQQQQQNAKGKKKK